MNRLYVLFAAFLAVGTCAAQQLFAPEELLRGYCVTGDRVTFLFDERLYSAALGGASPRVVMVEGTMRGWDHNMNDTAWELRRSSQSGVWVLELPKADIAVVAPGSEFKFRIDEGRWLDPPSHAPNLRNGNLVFAHSEQPPKLKAEIVSSHLITLKMTQGRDTLSTDPTRYILTDAAGHVIPIALEATGDPTSVRVVPARKLDSTRVHFLEETGFRQRLLCSFDGWYRHLFSEKKLGANFEAEKDSTIFRIFSPRATKVVLYLYKERTGDQAYARIDMNRDEHAVWEAVVPGNLEGVWYDFTVHGPDDPGNEFFEQHPVHITDPYARVSDDSFGRARVWPKMQPASPSATGIPRMEDVIAYEVHVEDFTLLLSGISEAERGRIGGFYRSGLSNSRGVPIGIDHLTDLGINVVHLLPMQEYLHYPDAEWSAAFAADSAMRVRGIATSNYDWGYRTTHAFAIESRYRNEGTEHGTQNRQFRDLVQTFHDRGIAVIVDMVFNHTAERMDGREMHFNFRVLDRHYHYRTGNDLNFIGEYGTETKSEDRPMMRRWIIDQCLAFIEEYGVDGFRIDLAGLTDEQTLRELRRRIGPEKIVYGEPWIGSSDPAYEANPDWEWYKEDAPITFFQDECRNAICGPPDNPSDKTRDRGYAGGNGRRFAARQAVANTFQFEDETNEGINYLDIHDNWALADRFARRDWNGELGVDEGPYRVAAALLLTSLGPVVLHGGSEFMRSKGSAPLVSEVRRTATGPIYIHGKRDTYNLRNANLFQWENLGRNTEDGAQCNFQRMNEYWRGLIALRRSDAGSVLRIGGRIPKTHMRWIEPADSMQLGYIAGDRVMVLVNTAGHAVNLRLPPLPEGLWTLVADGDRAGTEAIRGRKDSQLTGGSSPLILMDPTSVKIWRNDRVMH